MNKIANVGASAAGAVPMKEIGITTDTRDILAHAKQRMKQLGFQDTPIFDVDTHHSEVASWSEIAQFIEDPVLRESALEMSKNRPSAQYGLNVAAGLFYQDVAGRIPHQTALRESPASAVAVM